MNELILGGIVTVVTTTIGSVVTYLVTRKKYKAEVETNVISNMGGSLDFYKKISDDTNKRLDDILKKNNELIASNESLEKEVRQLKVTVDDLTTRLSKYEKVRTYKRKSTKSVKKNNNNLKDNKDEKSNRQIEQ